MGSAQLPLVAGDNNKMGDDQLPFIPKRESLKGSKEDPKSTISRVYYTTDFSMI